MPDADLDTWAARHWRLWRCLHPWRSWGPRCNAEPPWRLIDAGPCIVYRGHERREKGEHADWHADGSGFIWNATRWQWMGPVIGPEEYAVAAWGEYRDPPSGPVFIEGTSATGDPCA